MADETLSKDDDCCCLGMDRDDGLHESHCPVYRRKASLSSKQRGDSTELYYSEMEAARNSAEDQYFGARPQLLRTFAETSIFRAGFERAFQLLWQQRGAAETDEQRWRQEAEGTLRKVLEPHVVELLKRVGDGDLLAGIAHAANVVRLDEERLDALMPDDQL